MVSGISKFREYFKDFNDFNEQYTLIVGSAIENGLFKAKAYLDLSELSI